MEALADLIAGLLLIAGAMFALLAAVGLLRLPDIYSRMHAASKAGTLGSGLMLIALAVHAGDTATTSRAIAGVVFFLLPDSFPAPLRDRRSFL